MIVVQRARIRGQGKQDSYKEDRKEDRSEANAQKQIRKTADKNTLPFLAS